MGNRWDTCRYVSQLAGFAEATQRAEELGRDYPEEAKPIVAPVAVNGNEPDGWVPIVCAMCGMEGRVPPGMIPEGMVPVCGNCSRKLR